MHYRATLTIDFTQQNPNDYQKLIAALLALGWKYQETSALALEAPTLEPVWGAFDLIARQSQSAGHLSALSIHVQGSSSQFNGIPYQAAANHPNAKEDIQKKRFPNY
jgi:hypothetical protein